MVDGDVERTSQPVSWWWAPDPSVTPPSKPRRNEAAPLAVGRNPRAGTASGWRHRYPAVNSATASTTPAQCPCNPSQRNVNPYRNEDYVRCPYDVNPSGFYVSFVVATTCVSLMLFPPPLHCLLPKRFFPLECRVLDVRRNSLRILHRPWNKQRNDLRTVRRIYTCDTGTP